MKKELKKYQCTYTHPITDKYTVAEELEFININSLKRYFRNLGTRSTVTIWDHENNYVVYYKPSVGMGDRRKKKPNI